MGQRLLARGKLDGFCSAGNTGAAVASSTVRLRTLKGVSRPGILSPMPNDFGTCNLIDAGANTDAKPEHLLHYAVMGSIYARQVLGRTSPIVGLMSVCALVGAVGAMWSMGRSGYRKD